MQDSLKEIQMKFVKKTWKESREKSHEEILIGKYREKPIKKSRKESLNESCKIPGRILDGIPDRISGATLEKKKPRRKKMTS